MIFEFSSSSSLRENTSYKIYHAERMDWSKMSGKELQKMRQQQQAWEKNLPSTLQKLQKSLRSLEQL